MRYLSAVSWLAETCNLRHFTCLNCLIYCWANICATRWKIKYCSHVLWLTVSKLSEQLMRRISNTTSYTNLLALYKWVEQTSWINQRYTYTGNREGSPSSIVLQSPQSTHTISKQLTQIYWQQALLIGEDCNLFVCSAYLNGLRLELLANLLLRRGIRVPRVRKPWKSPSMTCFC